MNTNHINNNIPARELRPVTLTTIYVIEVTPDDILSLQSTQKDDYPIKTMFKRDFMVKNLSKYG